MAAFGAPPMRRSPSRPSSPSSPSPLPAAAQDAHSPNMTYVKNLPYEARNGGTANSAPTSSSRGSAGAQYALAGSYDNGLQIVDITRSGAARRSPRVYDCGVTQGDSQVFRRPTSRAARSSTYTSDTSATARPRATGEARGARLRRAQGGRHRPQRHVHRRRHRSAGAADRLLRRGPAGLAQPDRAPERQLPLQLELGPDHVARSRRSRSSTSATWRRPARPASWRCPRVPASAPSRTTSPSARTARAPTRPRSRRA